MRSPATSNSRDPRVGSTLNQTYRIERLLGYGGMGIVYAAQHIHLQRAVAVKVLQPQIAEMKVPLERFRREAQIASQLGHPGLVSVLDFNFTEDGAPYMVMELLVGETLSQRLTRGPLSLQDTCGLFYKLCDALHVVHEAGVVHRDLKPDNIFLLPEDPTQKAAVPPGDAPPPPAPGDGRDTAIALDKPLLRNAPLSTLQVKVLDFGVSKIHDASQRLTQDVGAPGASDPGELTGFEVLGTPSYLSPEQATGMSHEVDRRADVFALGTILYECLTGQKAFDGPHAVAILRIMMTEPVPRACERLPSLPPAVDEVIRKACARDPAARFATARELCDALSAAVSRAPSPTTPEWGEGDTLFDAEVDKLRAAAKRAYGPPPPMPHSPTVPVAPTPAIPAAATPSPAPPGPLPPLMPMVDPGPYTIEAPQVQLGRGEEEMTIGVEDSILDAARPSIPLPRSGPHLPPFTPSDRPTAILDTLPTPAQGWVTPQNWSPAADATRDLGRNQEHLTLPPGKPLDQKSWMVTATTAALAVLVGVVVGMLVLKLMARNDNPSLAVERTQQVQQLLIQAEKLAEQGHCDDATQRASLVLTMEPENAQARRLLKRCRRP